MTPAAFAQCFQTPHPGGPRHLVVHPERAPLPVVLRAASPRPAACEAERDGSPARRVLGQRAETAEGGVRASQLMSCRATPTPIRLSVGGFRTPLESERSKSIRRIRRLCREAAGGRD